MWNVKQNFFHDMYWPCYNVWPCCRGKDTECAKYDRLVVRLWRGILGPQLVAQPRPLLVSAAPPPATNTLGHQTSRRCNHRGFPQFFTSPTCGPYPIHTHTHNLKADINAVMVFVCVVIFPTVVHHLSWSCCRLGWKSRAKVGLMRGHYQAISWLQWVLHLLWHDWQPDWDCWRPTCKHCLTKWREQ